MGKNKSSWSTPRASDKWGALWDLEDEAFIGYTPEELSACSEYDTDYCRTRICAAYEGIAREEFSKAFNSSSDIEAIKHATLAIASTLLSDKL